MSKPLPVFDKLPRDPLVTGLTTCAVFLICLLAQGALNRQMAQRHLHNLANGLLTNFEKSFTQAQQELSALPPLESLNCESGVSVALAERIFYNDKVRWLAIEEGDRLLCLSHRIGMNWFRASESEPQVQRMNGNWVLESLKTPGQDQRGLFLTQERGARRYIAALEPPHLEEMRDALCEDCVAYGLHIGDTFPLTLASPKLAEAVLLEHKEHLHNIEGVKLALHLVVGQHYLDMLAPQGWRQTVAAALIVALTTGWLIRHVLHIRSSPKFLIKEALRQRHFVPFYQPIVDSSDGRLLGAEALVRWIDADGKVIPPGQFIPYAEDSGLIRPITQQLTEKIVADMVRLNWTNSDCFISINTVPEQLEDPIYTEYLLSLLSKHAIATHHISLEVTERRQFNNMEEGKKVLQQLVAAGVEIKLDDAGTGFGGFAYVQELPIGTLKIDKMFIDTLRSGHDAKRTVLDAIIEFARISKLAVIAEGVETVEQVQQLSQLGVHAIQGYVYGKPMPIDDFEAWRSSRNTITESISTF